MTQCDPLLESPPSAAESEMARHFAEAVESGVPGCADPCALSVARLLESLSGDPAVDTLAADRARMELVTLASIPPPPKEEESFTTEEAEMARRLAETLEPGASGCADARTISVVRLLETLSANPSGDDFAARRTRKEWVARASRARFPRIAGRVAAAAALVAVALSGALLLRSPGRPSEQLLAQREKAARAAVASLAVFGNQDSGDARLRDQMDDLRTERFASALRSERTTALLSQAEASSPVKGGADKSQIPTVTQDPGGAS